MSITQHFGRTHGNAAGGGDPPARRVWVQNVAVNALALQVRLDAVMARSPSPSAEQLAIDKGVRSLIDRALKASKREDPLPTRFGNWWRGTLIEAAYQNLHAAEALIVMLFDDNEIEVEVPEAVARVARGLKADDPRRLAAEQFKKVSPKSSHELRKTIEIGHAWAEQEILEAA